MTTTTHDKIIKLRDSLRGQFYERSSVIDSSLVAILAREHVLLLGPPGTAKSALANAVCGGIQDATYFQWLLTKFSTPEELFGPISITKLQQDLFERNTSGKLPQAHIGFVDEIFKANSSILNSLLTLINERAFDNGTSRDQCPLITIFGASNELPDGKDLEALYDRFLLRHWLGYLGDRSSLAAMLMASDPGHVDGITLAELTAAQAEVDAVTMPSDTLECLLDCKSAVERAGVLASDRRWKRAIGALKAYAYLLDEDTVTQDHLDLLPDMLWREPGERSSLVQEVGKVANPTAAKAQQILDAAEEQFKAIPDPGVGKHKFLASAADANASFEQMVNELTALGDNRKVKDALVRVTEIHNNTKRAAARAVGVTF